MAYKKNILTIDFEEATAAAGKYTFEYNVYNSIAVSTGGFALNFGSDLFTPFRAVKNDGYFRVEFMGTNTSYYVAANAPTVLTTTAP